MRRQGRDLCFERGMVLVERGVEVHRDMLDQVVKPVHQETEMRRQHISQARTSPRADMAVLRARAGAATTATGVVGGVSTTGSRPAVGLSRLRDLRRVYRLV